MITVLRASFYLDSWNLYTLSTSHFSSLLRQHWKAILDTGKVRLCLSPKACLFRRLLIYSALRRTFFVSVLLEDALDQCLNNVQLFQGLLLVCPCGTKQKYLYLFLSIMSLFSFLPSLVGLLPAPFFFGILEIKVDLNQFFNRTFRNILFIFQFLHNIHR